MSEFSLFSGFEVCDAKARENINEINNNINKIDDEILEISNKKLLSFHRGYGWKSSQNLCRANTLKAIFNAYNVGGNCVELDVMKDINDKLWCIHERDLSSISNTSNSIGNVDGSTVKYLNHITGEVSEEGLLSLEDAIRYAKFLGLWLHIDIKDNVSGDSTTRPQLEDILNIFDGFDFDNYIISGAYDIAQYKTLKPKGYCAVNAINNENELIDVTWLEEYKQYLPNVYIYGSYNKMIKANIDLCHENGFLVSSTMYTNGNDDNGVPTKNKQLSYCDMVLYNFPIADENSNGIVDSKWITIPSSKYLNPTVFERNESYPLRFKREGNTLILDGCVQLLSAFNSTNRHFYQLPEGYRPTRNVICTSTDDLGNPIQFRVYATGYIHLMRTIAYESYNQNLWINGRIPLD